MPNSFHYMYAIDALTTLPSMLDALNGKIRHEAESLTPSEAGQIAKAKREKWLEGKKRK